MSTIKTLLVTCLVGLIASTTTASAQDVNQALFNGDGSVQTPGNYYKWVHVGTPLAQERSVKLVTGNGFAPFADENFPSGGLTTEIVERIFHAAGYTQEIAFLPWRRGYQSVLEHSFEATFPYTRTVERAKLFLFSAPLYLVEGGRFFVSRDFNSNPKSVTELAGHSMCRALGYAIPPYLSPMVKAGKIDVVQSPAPANSLRMMLLGRCDFVLWNELIANITLKSVPESENNVRKLEINTELTSFHFIVAKDHPQSEILINVVDRGIERLKESGEYNRIVERHLENS